MSGAPRAGAELRAVLTRREVLHRAGVIGISGLVASALDGPGLIPASAQALTLPDPDVSDATMQAFADTMIPGVKVSRTESGQTVHPLAIAGVDSRPGAVQADALAAYSNPEIDFDKLAPVFLADLDSRSLPHGADFLHLDFDKRVQVCLSGLDFSNQARLIWEAAAAVPFDAFCAATLIRNATAADACGYRVMGLPGTAPNGYRGFSYRRRLSSERTRTGSLP
jgi:hypothetical protein